MATKWELKFAAGGLKEAKTVFRKIEASIDPAVKVNLSAAYKLVRGEIQQGFYNAAAAVRDDARRRAQSAGVPRRIYSGNRPAIFAFADFEHGKDDKRKRSALVGVRTGLATRARDANLYIQWYPKGNRRSKDNSRLGYGGLSVSFGGFFERGRLDKKIKPARFFRGAVYSQRANVLRFLTQAYYKAAAIINNAKGLT